MSDIPEGKKIQDVVEKLDGAPDWGNVGKVWESCYVENGVLDKEATKDLFCHGCAHSAADEKFPGKPSGERPCFFCIRNKDREKNQARIKKDYGKELREWYDKSPIAFYPMDVYTTLDMKEQMERWSRRDKGEVNWNEPRGGLRFG